MPVAAAPSVAMPGAQPRLGHQTPLQRLREAILLQSKKAAGSKPHDGYVSMMHHVAAGGLAGKPTRRPR